MDKNKIIAYSFMGLTLVICIIGYFILPDTLVLQLKFNGDAGTTLSKPLGLLFLLALGVLGGFMARIFHYGDFFGNRYPCLCIQFVEKVLTTSFLFFIIKVLRGG